ncbi:uncharacterized protein LOC120116887 [Hibiscus syriacus]|uniref:uncharacterized protein LOC120116887 n=1 Tax=Hibiscus syriacus TaxID=106335 RepID=UPI0019233B1D|nr:uncharacterized protein LOC120116887 [Hibiscus syriacus]
MRKMSRMSNLRMLSYIRGLVLQTTQLPCIRTKSQVLQIYVQLQRRKTMDPMLLPKKKITSSNPNMEPEVKKANNLETLANAEVSDLMLHSLLPQAGQFDEKSIVTMLDLETIKKLKESFSTIKDKNAIQHFSPKYGRKRTNGLNWTKDKDAAAQSVNNLDLDPSKYSADHLNKKKKLNSSSLKIMSEEATMHTSISASDMLIIDSSSNSMGIIADLSKKVKVWPAI